MMIEPVDTTPTVDQSLAEALCAAREAYRSEISLARGGAQAAFDYSTLLDLLLVRIHAEAASQTETAVTLIAIGGYGRQQLCLYSDIDLLILFGGPIAAPEERLVKALLHPLWDLGLDIGHQVRQASEFEYAETDNPQFLAAVDSSRFLTGNTSVFERFDTLIHSPVSNWRQATIEALVSLVADRHARFNATIYQLEPDIKEAPGALRDVAAIRTFVALTQPDAGRTVPVTSGRLDEALDEAEEFYLRIRSLLHLENGRNLNILSHEHQESVAERFGSPGSETSGQVEALMSVYFHHARIIARILAAAITEASPPTGSFATTQLDDNLQRNAGGITFVDTVRASLQPRTWLSAFQAAIDEGCPVSPETLAFVERHGDRYAPEEFFSDTKEDDQFLHFLKPKPGLYRRLSEMQESGLLGRMFPEFRKIYCRVIRDFYHKYTVDEHTLLTIHNLSELAEPNTTTRQRFANILAELANPELIVLALLFHDVGKWTNKNHTEESVLMVDGPLRRLRMNPASIRTIKFLIQQHLQMSMAAFRRDGEDPEVVRQFARLVATEDNLKMLCLLTLVDIQAVSPETLTPWKEELLWRLYVDTYNHLTLGYADDVIATGQSSISGLLAHRPPEISENQVTEFLEGLPQRYLRLVDPLTVYDHIRLSRDLETDEMRLTLDKQADVWVLSVATKDRPRIFSNVCGVLSYFGMDILRGQAMSNRHNVVLDLFHFVDADRFLALNECGSSELTRLLQDVVTGNADLTAMLKGREAALLAKRDQIRVRNLVHFDHQYSGRYTVLEIGSANQWGLLYRVSRVISEHGCDIELVLISTEGNRAIDVFHLTRSGDPLSASKEQNLRSDLEQILDLTHGADENTRTKQ